MIPAADAAWIRDHVLTPAHRDDIRDALRARCACQYGPCGHCEAGNHAECAVVAWGGAPRVHGDTYITTSRGQVAVARGVPSAEVWRSGRPCRWICPCGCAPVGAELPPVDDEPVQLGLFAGMFA